MERFTLFFDGCSKGNPGKAGAGAVLYKHILDKHSVDNEMVEIWCKSHYVSDKQTNNYAEYMGLIIGLEEAKKNNIKDLIVNGDSLLVIKQMKREYKVNSANILPLYGMASDLSKFFTSIEFNHVYRKDNKRADALANESLLLLNS